MGRGQHNNKPLSKLEGKIASQRDGEYDLERNLKKIKAYSKPKKGSPKRPESTTKSYDNNVNKTCSKNIIENIDYQPLHSPTGEIPWESYTRLEDRITDFSEKNDKAHTELRHELEDKINEATTQLGNRITSINGQFSNYLHIYWYRATIAALIAIVTIWYIFSYQEVHLLPRQMQDIDHRLQSVEQGIENRQDTIKNNTTKP